MSKKEIKKETYVWAHVGVIVYHSLTAGLLILSQYGYTPFSTSPRTTVLVLASILLFVSLLSFWPIVKDYDKIVIE
jgi:hypothetical protein